MAKPALTPAFGDVVRTGFGDWLSQFPSPRRFGFTRRDAMTCSEIRLCEQAYAAGARRGYVLGLDHSQEPEHGQSASV